MSTLTDEQRAAFEDACVRLVGSAWTSNPDGIFADFFLAGIAQGRKEQRAEDVQMLRMRADEEHKKYDQPYRPYHTFRANAFEEAADLLESEPTK